MKFGDGWGADEVREVSILSADCFVYWVSGLPPKLNGEGAKPISLTGAEYQEYRRVCLEFDAWQDRLRRGRA